MKTSGANALFLCLLTMLIPALSIAKAQEQAEGPDDAVSFVTQIRPLLQTKCISCHGPDKQEGGLRLDSLNAAIEGGDRGPSIQPGDSAGSLVIEAIGFQNSELEMPPRQRLTDREIDLFSKWIQQGAAWPESDSEPGVRPDHRKETSSGDAFSDPKNPIRQLFGTDRLDLWSLKPPVAILPVGIDENSTPSNLIDSFIGERLAQDNLSRAPEADRRTLIRRLTFDLTGLPPSPAEVNAFLVDRSPRAFERLVDRLLDSPRYGERQARLWLDVIRYADTNGYERDEFRPLAWKFRDYVIRSFNNDKQFDQFIREQLAGDELVNGPPQSPAEADMLIATGYLRLGQWDSTAAIFQEEERLRAEQLADLTNTTASAFLAMTMSCCQCHDHKYDPLTQADHFRLRAFFAAVEPRDDFPVSLAADVSAIDQHNGDLEAQLAPLKTELEALNAEADDQKARLEELQKQIAELEATRRQPDITMAATDSGAEAPATHLFYQGDFSSPREELQPGYMTVLYPGPANVEAPRDNTTGRRLALATWIASADNRWTARVIVNRIWQQHFGTGIVATANDFGYTGSRPSHPELLDWLAVEFVRQGWSIKQLHRWIVNSATYRQRSILSDSEPPTADPQNSLLWRQNIQRLDAETLRDALLSVSGLLLPNDGGRPMWPEVPDELTHAQPAILEAIKDGDGGRMQGWYTDPVEETDVRSLFLIRKRCLPIPFLQVFDLPDTSVSCARRDTTVVAPQALMLLNSPEGIRYANSLANRLITENPDFNAQDAATNHLTVTRLFELALNRRPDTEEMTLAVDLLKRHATESLNAIPAEELQAPDSRTNTPKISNEAALTDLCRAVLNLNEFVYVD